MTRLIAALTLLPATLVLHANLITNGDFESGYSGFYTEYEYKPGDLWYVGFDIVSNPFDSHSMAWPYHDHTFGDGQGKMLMVNGDPRNNEIVWQQTVPVFPESQYDFSLWYSAWHPMPSFNAVLFNNETAFVFDANSSYAQWSLGTASWRSGRATSLTISIVNLDQALQGNDLALDDISLRLALRLTPGTDPVPTPDGGPTIFLLLGGAVSLTILKRRADAR